MEKWFVSNIQDQTDIDGGTAAPFIVEGPRVDQDSS